MADALARTIASFLGSQLDEGERQADRKRREQLDARSAEQSRLQQAIQQMQLDAPNRAAAAAEQAGAQRSRVAVLAERLRGGDESAALELETEAPEHDLLTSRNQPPPRVSGGAPRTEKGPDGMVYVEQADGSWAPAKGMATAQSGPRAPVRGTKEYEDMLRREARIQNEGRPVPQPRAPRPPTEGQRKAEALLTTAEQANNLLRSSGKEAPSWLDQQKSKVGFGLGNVMTGDEYQRMRQAALQLSDAWLRYTSGASAPETEVERMALTFLPVAGDKGATLKQKAAARETIIRALRKGAGAQVPDNALFAEDFDLPNKREE